MSLAAGETSQFEVEEIGGEALNAERRPITGGTRVDVAAQPALQIEIGRDSTAVEELVLAVLEPAVAQRAFRLDPELIVIGADPTLSVPAELGLGTIPPAFELIKDDMRQDRPVHNRLHGFCV